MPRKLAVLGGGISALAAVWELSKHRPDVEITVYQMGFRLGGKCASGRGPHPIRRVEEHGLHVWFGFYENAFGLARDCYREIAALPPDERAHLPYTRLSEAFAPQPTVTLGERFDGTWRLWQVEFPSRDGEPGLGNEPTSFWGCLSRLLGVLRENLPFGESLPPIESGPQGEDLVQPSLDLLESAETYSREAAKGEATPESGPTSLALVRTMLRGARQLIWLAVRKDLGNDSVRRFFRILDVVTATVCALQESGVWGKPSLDELDQHDFIDWIRPHILDPGIAPPDKSFEETSPVLRFIYNSAFAFEAGDVSKPRLGAGVTVRALFRMIGYPQDVAYCMRGSMADVLIAPMYEILRRRGVRFRFFHRVDALLVADGKVETIVLQEQTQRAQAEYEPLDRDHHGKACWPSEPLVAQLAGAQPQSDFENPEVKFEAAKTELARGTDFDDVLIGIPIEGLKPILREWLERDHPPAWERMFDGVKTVATQAFQLWTTKPLASLRVVPHELVGTFVEPVDTVCDMTRVLAEENWESQALGLAYFCGVLPEPVAQSGDDAIVAVRNEALRYLRADAPVLWPHAFDENGNFVWSNLADPEGRDGRARLDAQYFRANIRQAERYTLSLPKTTALRLKPDESGLENCVLCGDWTRNGLNAGCVEASVMSGLLAARKLEAPGRVVAEDDRWLWG